MQGRFLHVIARRLHSSTSQISSLRRFSSSGEETLTENLSAERPTLLIQTPQSYKQNPSENFASGPNNPLYKPNPNLSIVSNTNPISGASLPEVNKCIWAVERLSKGKASSLSGKQQGRVPGYVYSQDASTCKHVLVLMDKFQIQSLLHLLGEERFMTTIFTLEVFDGFGSNNVLYQLRVLPRRINFDQAGEISNVGYAIAPPGMKLRLDVPIRICGQEDCKGLKKGGFFKIHLLYASLFCLPEELPPYVEIKVNDMDIGDRICLGDLRIGVPLHSNIQPSLPVCEII